MRNDNETPGALVARVIHAALHRTGKITIRLADLPDEEDGRCDFADGTIYIARELDPAALRTTVAHEFVHLARGPVQRPGTAAEEILVEQVAAEALVPAARDLASLKDEWTNADIEILAKACGVDTAIMRQLIDPPTVPLILPLPRDTGDTSRAARRRRST